MEYVYATLTLNETGQEINEQNLTAVLEAAGADVVESRVKAIVAALEGLDIHTIGAESGIAPPPSVDPADNADPRSRDTEKTAETENDSPDDVVDSTQSNDWDSDKRAAAPDDEKATQAAGDSGTTDADEGVSPDETEVE